MRLFPLRQHVWHVFSLVLTSFALSATGCNTQDDFEEPGERISVENKYGKLVGRLVVPDEEDEDFPAVIIIPDSGDLDRNGNSFSGNRTNAYIQLSLRLAEKGVAALRYDKAGLGYSQSAAPDAEEDARFEMAAKDAALFVAALREDKRIDSITLIGHGDGGLVAMLTHGIEKVDSIVTVATSAYSIEVQLREELEAIKDKKLRTEALAILDKLVAGKKVKDVPFSLGGVFRPTVQPYLMSWLKYDPSEELSKIDVPSLVIHGTNDLEVDPADADVLAAANPEAQLKKIKGMNHVLKLDPGETITKQVNQSYSSPVWELAPDLVKAIAKFAKQ
jgi:pimeloyl-ACP methyl ester carboxylesterase